MQNADPDLRGAVENDRVFVGGLKRRSSGARRRQRAPRDAEVPSLTPSARAIVWDPMWHALAETLPLSPREFEIVRALCEDKTESAIAAELAISRHTVHTHLQRVYRKLGVSSRVDLVVRVFVEYVLLRERRSFRTA